MKLDKPLSLDFDESEPERSLQLTDSSSSVSALDKQVAQLQNELQAKNKLLEAKSQELSELKTINRQLEQANREIQERQKILDEELSKAEGQIELIHELLLNEEQTEQLSGKERGTHE